MSKWPSSSKTRLVSDVRMAAELQNKVSLRDVRMAAEPHLPLGAGALGGLQLVDLGLGAGEVHRHAHLNRLVHTPAGIVVVKRSNH